MRAIDVIGVVENLELYQTLVGISAPRWSYSTVEIHGSATLELFFQSWSSPKQALWQQSARIAMKHPKIDFK
jgi:hypothetical protein